MCVEVCMCVCVCVFVHDHAEESKPEHICVRVFGLRIQASSKSHLMIHCQDHETRFKFIGNLMVHCRYNGCYCVVSYALTTSLPLN